MNLVFREHSSLLKQSTLLAFPFTYLSYKTVANTKVKPAKHCGNHKVNTIILNLLSDTFPNNIREIFLVFNDAHLLISQVLINISCTWDSLVTIKEQRSWE